LFRDQKGGNMHKKVRSDGKHGKKKE